MAMTLVNGRIAAQKIVIPFSFNVIYIYAFAFFKDYGQGVVVMGTILVLQCQIISILLRYSMSKHDCELCDKNEVKYAEIKY
jgi:hypothetical protein